MWILLVAVGGATTPCPRAGPIGEGPWGIYCNGTLCGYGQVLPGDHFEDGWVEVYRKLTEFHFLSPTYSWEIWVCPAPATSYPAQRVGLTPSTLNHHEPKDPGTLATSSATVRAWHAPGHYNIQVIDDSRAADLWVVNTGPDLRTELFCLPAEFPWPSDKVSPEVAWRISWADNSAFSGCAPGESLEAYTVNLKPN